MNFLFSLILGVVTIVQADKIWDGAKHSAFTDLVYYQGKWIVAFREGDDHVGGSDGTIRLLESADGKSWSTAAVLTEKGADLRDPKLSITPEGKLMLLVQGKQPAVTFSESGTEWSSLTKIMEPGEWLWRVTWHEGTAYGFSYRFKGEEWTVALFKSPDGIHFEKVADLAVPGRPSEGTLEFTPEGEMVALLRRSKNAWVGRSLPPYTNWRWKDAGMHLGGPDFVILPDGSMWASGREVIDKQEKTIIAKIVDDKLQKVDELPSGGDDCSYPGLIYRDGFLWISYYSSHEGKSSIYFAKVKVN